MRYYALAPSLCLFLVLSACTVNKESEPSAIKDSALSTSTKQVGHVGLGAESGLAERVLMSRQECQNANGQEVGDIGDGRIHQNDYLCASGEPPLGTIIASDDEPVAIEGSVCCGL